MRPKQVEGESCPSDPGARGAKDPAPFKYHFFVSYTGRDRETQEVLAHFDGLVHELRERGYTTAPIFFDRFTWPDSPSGADCLRQRLLYELFFSRQIIALVTGKYLTSDWCRLEWDAMRSFNAEANDAQTLAIPIILTGQPLLWTANGQFAPCFLAPQPALEAPRLWTSLDRNATLKHIATLLEGGGWDDVFAVRKARCKSHASTSCACLLRTAA